MVAGQVGKKKIRIIPRLDVKGNNLVKGVHLEGLRVIGRPEDYAKYYYETGADEIIFMDSVASLYGRNNLSNIVETVADQIFIPLTVGGGIRSVEDADSLFRSGADKVAINTFLFKDDTLVPKIADKYGSQSVVVSIDVTKIDAGKYQCLTDNGRERTNEEVFNWVEKIIQLGAGEVLLTQVDLEGTGLGFDLELAKSFVNFSKVPVIICGGGGTKEHVLDLSDYAIPEGIAISSLFHYDAIRTLNAPDKITEGNTGFINQIPKTGSLRKGIDPISIQSLKKYLDNNNIRIRHYDHNS